MSSKVTKSLRRPALKTRDRNSLLQAILEFCVDMPSCLNCEVRGLSSCQVSAQFSDRCSECVRLGQSRCDVLGPSSSDLRSISRQHRKLEDEMEELEEARRALDARIDRVRKQKRMWRVRLARAIQRSLDSVKTLERVEREEAEAERRAAAEANRSIEELVPVGPLPADSDSLSQMGFDSSLLEEFDFSALQAEGVPPAS
ncbi:hypothetical protein M406DRAFT_357122 [Cryphonectria parasitica EP155]|uniref:Uncharacterized protein n=1 Tax=Cryphonectria parasitica (strain ATCC 38755 / EP155) TaxID=660469 RepID=A0A9P5CLX8_CRYP1|nr:uncharacterized protein M406DRAFT_357122 [Cryphonectria parasitica EP155]KAF3763548.1 hypothetical protein M406DRAFT_357122 [Cryphonectria parasitica EP155]